MSEPTLTVIDNRTGKQYKLPLENGHGRGKSTLAMKNGILPEKVGMPSSHSCFLFPLGTKRNPEGVKKLNRAPLTRPPATLSPGWGRGS